MFFKDKYKSELKEIKTMEQTKEYACRQVTEKDMPGTFVCSVSNKTSPYFFYIYSIYKINAHYIAVFDALGNRTHSAKDVFVCDALKPKTNDKIFLAIKLSKSHPVGVLVVLIDDMGQPHFTRTRSEIWNLCGTDVVKVNGFAGGYSIDRIFVCDFLEEREESKQEELNLPAQKIEKILSDITQLLTDITQTDNEIIKAQQLKQETLDKILLEFRKIFKKNDQGLFEQTLKLEQALRKIIDLTNGRAFSDLSIELGEIAKAAIREFEKSKDYL